MLKETNEKITIKIITTRDKEFYVKFKSRAKIEYLSDFRLNIEREEFINLKEKISKETKANLFKMFNNLKQLGICQLNEIFLMEFIEYHLIRFFNEIFGEYELLNKILLEENYDRAILFDYNPILIKILKSSNLSRKNIEIFKNCFLVRKKNITAKLSIISYILSLLKYSLIAYFSNKSKKSRKKGNTDKNYIVFVANTKNQVNSMKPIYNFLKNENNFNVFHYQGRQSICLKKFFKLITFLINLKKNG